MRTFLLIWLMLATAACSNIPSNNDTSGNRSGALQYTREGAHEKAAALLSPTEARSLGVEWAAKSKFEAAAFYLKSAAERGHQTAQFEYAFLLATSDPPTRNVIEAFAWAQLVADTAGTDAEVAKEMAQRIMERLSSPDRQTALARAQKVREQVQSIQAAGK